MYDNLLDEKMLYGLLHSNCIVSVTYIFGKAMSFPETGMLRTMHFFLPYRLREDIERPPSDRAEGEAFSFDK